MLDGAETGESGAPPLPSAARLQELLFDAARLGRDDMIDPLLRAGADPAARDARGYTALILASYNGHAEATAMLLAAGVDVDAPDEARGNTALMGVAFKGFTDIAQQLVAAGADIDRLNNAGQTALMMSALFGKTAVVALLLEAGANADLVDAAGNSARSVAAAQSNADMLLLLDGPPIEWRQIRVNRS